MLTPMAGYRDPITAIAGASVAGGILGSRSASKAASAQQAASDAATAEQRRQFNLARKDTAPYRDVGQNALSALSKYQFGEGDPEELLGRDPGYRFRQEQGQNAFNNYLAGTGMRLSGRALKELTRYNQGFASQEYGNALNRLYQLANYGVGGTAQAIGAGQNAANNISSIQQNLGNNLAQSAYNKGSAWNNAIQGGMGNYYFGKAAKLW
jgi:hypothetical protein